MAQSVEDPNVYFEVAMLDAPFSGFAVVRMDLDEAGDGGVPAEVISTHHDRDEAHSEANRLALGPLAIN